MRVACLGECMLEVGVQTGAAQFGFGGDTLNTAVYLARTRSPSSSQERVKVEYVTALGTDPMSDEMVRRWNHEGVDTASVLRLDDALPGLYLIRTDDSGERSFYYWREQAAVRQLLDGGRAAALAQGLAGTDVLYLSGITLAIFEGDRRESLLDVLHTLRASGTRIAFDTNYRPRLWPDVQVARTDYARMATVTDIALAGVDDEAALHGDQADGSPPADGSPEAVLNRWRASAASEVVVRCGEQPALAWDGRQVQAIAPAHVLSPVDTTAAGDSFNAAYLAARLRGESQRSAVEAGHALAGRVVMQRGAIVD